jgi:hypothetical protein
MTDDAMAGRDLAGFDVLINYDFPRTNLLMDARLDRLTGLRRSGDAEVESYGFRDIGENFPYERQLLHQSGFEQN